jgi:hypothetical protein
VDGAKPSERRRVAIEHRDDPAMRRHVGEQFLDMRTRVNEAALARALCRCPAGVETIGRGDGEQTLSLNDLASA